MAGAPPGRDPHGDRSGSERGASVGTGDAVVGDAVPAAGGACRREMGVLLLQQALMS